MAGITLDRVSKRYGDGYEAVKQLDLDIGDGEFVIFVGPSGCGKTTALRMIAGLEEISDGEIRIDGARVNETAPKDRDIAMVFQNYALYPHMTVAENMGFALKLAKTPKSEIQQKVREAAEVLDLVEHLDRKPGQLSGGQRQRVAMGRAIVREPKAFLMDEPLSNLDAKLRVEMRTAIARLQQNLGTTTIYVTHDQIEAVTLGDRVAVLRDGVLQQFASPRELYERPAKLFVAGFIGSPAMNFARGELTSGGVQTAIGVVPLPDRLRTAVEAGGGRREVVLGARPEAFALQRDTAEKPGYRFTATAEVVESLGSEVQIHFAFGESALSTHTPVSTRGLAVAKLPGDAVIEVGQPVELWLDGEKLHVFDADSGESLTVNA
ncbi:sn-glycerol-3-phosphate ABC transporter ATP-binding protein UgpC [Conexibacter sp. JD483]|uniref:ABC transporter ATP-binding protein n=1 Tax=unclassified Conexibacter TaxID=2627773 RepID=UPI0027265E11|nr:MULTISPECIES: sn-glycerol-3-phosphate ABC transporter ATP-binding protein UgpC [unclassified Conexibacter]MDO8189261.1 sn-glycerol-3-phosphate ABC transporter ATP-binding protein UgpC [Conexibacter sp. CPCC 205706]MDO8201268.1 sn-glycerol-3-phosphate ABC transporter ATP-binding protein UgpC [Conexibacter sp. CPCC 205762]MDR9372177.1 sn-glycerol-3-phosphate ABC transporter ATP-binding protein UgpC [Conexibacter sp. JD483]